MCKLTKRLVLTAMLLSVSRLCFGQCVPVDSPSQPNQDPLARLLKAQAQCPTRTIDFRSLVERSGARLETTMVNFLSFHNPNPGAFFLFEIVSGNLAGVNVSVERGDLLFGHFLTATNNSQLVLDSTNRLLVEAIAWDPVKQMFNFYELFREGSGPPSWFYRGDSRVVLEDIQCQERVDPRRSPGWHIAGEHGDGEQHAVVPASVSGSVGDTL
jgi:hypothetical protein